MNDNNYIARIATELRSFIRVQTEIEYWLVYNGDADRNRVGYILGVLQEQRRASQDRMELWQQMVDVRNGSRAADLAARFYNRV